VKTAGKVSLPCVLWLCIAGMHLCCLVPLCCCGHIVARHNNSSLAPMHGAISVCSDCCVLYCERTDLCSSFESNIIPQCKGLTRRGPLSSPGTPSGLSMQASWPHAGITVNRTCSINDISGSAVSTKVAERAKFVTRAVQPHIPPGPVQTARTLDN
jgi:hypothetical protein